MRKFFAMLCILMICAGVGCSKKPEEEVLDAKDRAKQKVEEAREGQKEAAEETGEE